MDVYVWECSLSHVQLFMTLWTIPNQAPLSTEFPKQEYWSALPFPSPGDLPKPGFKAASPVSPALAGRLFITAPPVSPTLSCLLFTKPCEMGDMTATFQRGTSHLTELSIIWHVRDRQLLT